MPRHKNTAAILSVEMVNGLLNDGKTAAQIAQHLSMDEMALRNWASRNRLSMKYRGPGKVPIDRHLRIETAKHNARTRREAEQQEPQAETVEVPNSDYAGRQLPPLVPISVCGVYVKNPDPDAMVPVYPLVWGNTYAQLFAACGCDRDRVHVMVGDLLDKLVASGGHSDLLKR